MLVSGVMFGLVDIAGVAILRQDPLARAFSRFVDVAEPQVLAPNARGSDPAPTAGDGIGESPTARTVGTAVRGAVGW